MGGVFVFPTRNVHLVAAFPNARLDLTVCMLWPPNTAVQTWTDLQTVLGLPLEAKPFPGQGALPVQVLRSSSQPVPSPTGISLIALAPGTVLLDLHKQANRGNVHTIVRVTVHADITRLFLPYGTIYMLIGRADWIVTVFAEFTDGEQWDVTEHPYLEFDSLDHTVATIDASGRITAVAAGRAMLWVQPLGRPAQRQQVEVRVRTVAEVRAADELTVRRIARPATALFTIHFLAEGYVERERFFQHVTQLVERMFSEANAPFRWIKNRVAINAVYVRSAASRGITIGPPLAATPGPQSRALPLPIVRPPPLLDVPIVPDGHNFHDPARLSAFGLMYGARIGDIDGPAVNPANPSLATLPQVQAAWLTAVATRSISVDARRIAPYRDVGPPVRVFDPRVAFEDSIMRLLADVSVVLNKSDRVVFVVDDQFRGGARLPVISSLEPAENRFVALSIGDPAGFDGVAATAGSPFLMRNAVRETFHAGGVASSIIHEIGHTLGLGDEYEYQNRAQVGESEGARHSLEAFDNLELLVDVAPGGTVDLSRLKWNVCQAEKASRVLDIHPDFGFITVDIEGDATKLWKDNELVRLRTSFSTPRPRDPAGNADATIPRIREFPYQVLSTSGHEVRLMSMGATPGAEDEIHVLYKPKLTADGRDIRLLDPIVEDYVKAHGVFPKPPGGCVGTNRADPGGEAVPPPPIPNLKVPTYPADLIGLYEGGWDWACGVVRPAGRCKMRRGATYDEQSDGTYKIEVWEFCFVCKFIIVDRVDPSLLPKVQIHYPKDC